MPAVYRARPLASLHRCRTEDGALQVAIASPRAVRLPQAGSTDTRKPRGSSAEASPSRGSSLLGLALRLDLATCLGRSLSWFVRSVHVEPEGSPPGPRRNRPCGPPVLPCGTSDIGNPKASEVTAGSANLAGDTRKVRRYGDRCKPDLWLLFAQKPIVSRTVFALMRGP